jgi:hypothetical protein
MPETMMNAKPQAGTPSPAKTPVALIAILGALIGGIASIVITVFYLLFYERDNRGNIHIGCAGRSATYRWC